MDTLRSLRKDEGRPRRGAQAQTGWAGPDGGTGPDEGDRPRRDGQAQTGASPVSTFTRCRDGACPRLLPAPRLLPCPTLARSAPSFTCPLCLDLPPRLVPCPTLARSAPLFYLPALSRPAPRLLPCPTLAAHADQCPARKVSRLLAAGVDALRIACAATVITSRAAVVSVIEVIRPAGATRRSFLGGASKYIAFTMRP